jgi:SAM-dependent methyltransferase
MDKLPKEQSTSDLDKTREHVREIAAEFASRGDVLGWFEALYKESNGDTDVIPWADMEPNRFFKAWAESTGLTGNGRKALVVGCGLGDDANYLAQLGFAVTAFDISPTAIEWAKRSYGDHEIVFEVADLFQPKVEWLQAFDFVLEIYTIQPLPLEMRPRVIDSVAGLVADGGHLLVVTRGRDDDEEPVELPWPLSRRDLNRFETSGLTQLDFVEMPPDEEDEPPRFVVEYVRRPVG